MGEVEETVLPEGIGVPVNLEIQSAKGGRLVGVLLPAVLVGVVVELDRLGGGGSLFPSGMSGRIRPPGPGGRGPPLAAAEDMMFWMFCASRLILPEDMGGAGAIGGISVGSDWVGVASPPCKQTA